ncbi:MAG: PqqD family protein [Xanthomonadales bacterium]|nr:PqqD family protein [Xanthomonadales bacterium]
MTAAPARVTLDHQVQCSGEVLMQEVGGEAVLLDLASERYFGLDPVGTRIWQLLADAPSLAQVHAALCDEFDATPERIGEDLLALVGQLSEAGLVQVSPGPG